MGRRGPKPTPTAVLQLRGSWRAKESKRKGEAKFSGPAPRRPRGLGRIAAAEWNRVAPILAKQGLLTEVDRTALEAYCIWYEIYRKLLAALNRKGKKALAIGTTDYNRVQSAMSDASANMMRNAACFGITPADRSKVQTEPDEKKDDPLEEFLSGGGTHAKRTSSTA